MKKLAITLTGSTIGKVRKQKATVEALGLHRIGQTVVKEDTPVTRGMIRVVSHLVKVEETAAEEEK